MLLWHTTTLTPHLTRPLDATPACMLCGVWPVRDAVAQCNGCLPAYYMMVSPLWEPSRSTKVACLSAGQRRVRKGRRGVVQRLFAYVLRDG